MNPFAQRMKAVILRIGEVFAVGSDARRGVSSSLSPSKARTYLDDLTVDGAPRPMYALYVPFDDPTLEGDTAIWLGNAYRVARAAPLRHRGETVARLLVLVSE